MRNIKKEMMEVKAGKFQEWYNNLNEEELKTYKKEYEKLQLLKELRYRKNKQQNKK